jgi:single-strand DNA-binding protein
MPARGYQIVVIQGNVGRDPEVKELKNGSQVTEFSVAVNGSYKDQQGEYVETVEWFDITCWNQTAKFVGQYVKRGSLVLCEAKQKTDHWKDKDSGANRSKVKYTAHTVNLLDKKSDTTEEGPTADPSEFENDDLPF